MARVKVTHFCTQSVAFRRIFHMSYCRQFSCLILRSYREDHVDLPVKGKCCSRWLRIPTLRCRANDPGPSSPPENTSPMIPAPTSPTLVTVTMLSKLQSMVHSKKSIDTMWLPKGMNLQDTHCSLYCTVSWFAVMPTLTKTSHAAAPRPIPVLLQPLLSKNPGQGQLRF